jgi:hypothetical protein
MIALLSIQAIILHSDYTHLVISVYAKNGFTNLEAILLCCEHDFAVVGGALCARQKVLSLPDFTSAICSDFIFATEQSYFKSCLSRRFLKMRSRFFMI